MADYVPNMLRCAKCNFELERLTMNAQTGAVGIGTNEPERCPNGCGPLWRVTWEQEARYLGQRMNEWADRAIAAEKRLAGPTDDEIVAWADSFIQQRAFNRPVACQIAVEAAKWVRSLAHGVATGPVTLPQRVEELVKEHGVRGLARLLRTDPGYITRLRKGEKENPDDELLAEMGLRRVVTYERTYGVTVLGARSDGTKDADGGGEG